MKIRDAVADDALAISRLLRRSISQLCVADHRNDPEILTDWLSNKTPEIVATWIGRPGNSVLLAVDQGKILGVGAITETGEITLNYVEPEARFRGVSRAVLVALEARAVKQGNSRCTLTSTETARRFYLANSYIEDAAMGGGLDADSGYSMSKSLDARVL